MRTLILFSNFSAESKKVEKLLNDEKIKHITFLSDDDLEKPSLVVSGKICPYEGYKEISGFLSLFSNSLEKTT